MSLRRTIAQNTAIQAAGKIVGIALSLLAATMVLRYLHPEGAGKYTTILSFLQLFGIIMDAGLYIILIKKIAVIDDTTTPAVNTIFTLRLLSGVLFLGLAPFVAWILSFYNPLYSPEIILGIVITTFFYLCISLNQLLSGIFQKFLQTQWIAIGEFAGKLALLLSTILVVWLDAGLLWVMATLVISAGVNFCINFFASRRYFRLRLTIDWRIAKDVLRDAWPIAVSIAFGILYFKGDTVILTFYEDAQTIGWYGAPYKILEVLITFPAMFTGLVLPIITAAWQQQEWQRLQELIQKSFNGLVTIAFPMIAGTLVLAEPMMRVIAGPDYDPSAPILRILIIATGAIYIATLFGYVVPALNMQRQMMWAYIAVAVTSVIGYFFLIPRFSMLGAAWVTVYSEVMVLVIAMILTTRITRARVKLSVGIKSLAASGVMAAALALLFSPITDWLHRVAPTLSISWHALVVLVICIPFGAALYLISLLALRAFRVNDFYELIRLKSSS